MIEIEWIGLADRDAKVRDSFGGYHQGLVHLQSAARYLGLACRIRHG
jgi:hypothetical protein